MAENEDDGKKSSGGFVVGALIASVIAAGGGVFLGSSMFGEKPAQEAKAHADDKSHGKSGEEEKYTKPSRIRDLAPITTNLAGTPKAWIRIEGSLLLEEATVKPEEGGEEPSEEEVLILNISEDVVALLRTMTLTQIQGPSGFQALREDLNERVKIRSEGKVQEFIVRSMILE